MQDRGWAAVWECGHCPSSSSSKHTVDASTLSSPLPASPAWVTLRLSHSLHVAVQRYSDESVTIPRPDNWGGYLVRPSTMEFWQGRPSRLHDRLEYSRDSSGSWSMHRLAP